MSLENILNRQDVPEDVKEEVRKNIIESQNMENMLRNKNEIFLILASHIDGFIEYVNADTLKYEFVNDAFEKSFGIPKEKIIGSHIREIIGELNYQFALEFIKEVRSGKSISYENSFDLVSGKRWIEVNYSPITDFTGNVTAIAVFSYDITERKRTEDALKRSEEKWRKLVMTIPDYVALFDLEGKYLFLNHFAEGFSHEDIEEKTLFDTLPKEVQEIALVKFNTCVQSGLTQQFEVTSFGDNRFIRDYEWYLAPIKEKDHVTNVISIAKDITDKKMLIESLKESEEHWRRAITNSPIPIMIHDEDGQVLQISAGWTKYSGYTIKDIPTLTDWVERAYGENSVSKRDYIDHLFSIDRTEYNGEWIVTAKDGSKKIWDFQTTPLGKGNYGKRVLHSMAIDITESKHAVEAIKESEERFRKAFLTSPDSFTITRMNDGMLISVNEGFLSLTGYSEEEVINKSSLELNIWVNPQDRQNIVDILKTCKMVTNYEAGFHKKNGDIFYGLMSASIIDLNGTSCILNITRDITDRKKTERDLLESHKELEKTMVKLEETQIQVSQQERMRSLGQLASGIAHDINNSLTPIMGYLDILTDDEELMKRNEKPIKMIIKSSRNIARTIGRLKEFYKVKLTDEDQVEININNILESTIELTRHKWKDMAESTGSIIEIRRNYENNLPSTRVDESELIEALTNLVLNACDAMPNGGILTFKTYHKDHRIIIEVTDTGFGMDEETLKQCMNPFFSTKGEKGTGLGLAMAYGVIQRHKGIMNIESDRNKGTKISLILPINKDKTEDKTENKKNDFSIVLSRPLKILGVDDDIQISDMMKKILEQKNHRIVQASDGILGLELFKKSIIENEPFDLVITDLGMPGRDGYSLSKLIKEISPNIPIILLTGWGSLIDRSEYPAIDYLLEKPILRDDLFRVINMLFKEK